MTEPSIFSGIAPPHLIRLQTLLKLRWVSVGGQVAVFILAAQGLALEFNFGLAILAISIAVMVNVSAMALNPRNKRLTFSQATTLIVLDLAQLGLFLGAMGGLNNPFVMILLVPLTISAFLLPAIHTIGIGVLTGGVLVALAAWSLPVQTGQGAILEMQPFFFGAFFVALMACLWFLGFSARRVTSEMQDMSEALIATQMALSREQKLTDLGGVVAATAHELATPLSTIKLVSSELKDELGETRPDLLEDILLIRDQAARCRDILRSMGRAGKDDRHLRQAPLETVVAEAATPHTDRGREVTFHFAPREGTLSHQPEVLRKPEVIHGLRNLIQNAVDFARECVVVDGTWDDSHITIRITDDGTGFPKDILGRLGEPFISRRALGVRRKRQPASEGLGLGLFIAKTLLERSGAAVKFSNRRGSFRNPQSGAIVEVKWRRKDMEAPRLPRGFGENPPNTA